MVSRKAPKCFGDSIRECARGECAQYCSRTGTASPGSSMPARFGRLPPQRHCNPDQIPRKKRPRSRRSETRRSKSSPKQGDSFRGFRKGTAKERKTCSQREPVVGRSSENLPRRRRLVSVRRNTRPVWALQAAPGPAESKADSVGETAPTTRAKTPGVQGLGFRLQGSGFGVQV